MIPRRILSVRGLSAAHVTDLSDLHEQRRTLLITPPDPQDYEQTPAGAAALLDRAEQHAARLRDLDACHADVQVAQELMTRAAARLRAAWPALTSAQHERLLTLITGGHVDRHLLTTGLIYDRVALAWTTRPVTEPLPVAPADLATWMYTLSNVRALHHHTGAFTLWNMGSAATTPDERLAELARLRAACLATQRDREFLARYGDWRGALAATYAQLTHVFHAAAPGMQAEEVHALIGALIDIHGDLRLSGVIDELSALLRVFTPVDDRALDALRALNTTHYDQAFQAMLNPTATA